MNPAQAAHDAAAAGDHVIGWRIDAQQRAALLARFPPRYAHLIADHVTLRAQVAAAAAPPDALVGTIVGRSDDARGVEALVVEIEGSTARPGGGTYHITWSLAPGREAIESNDVIAACGWQPLERVPVRLEPGRWP